MGAPQAACKTTCLRRRKRQAMLRSAPIIHRLPKLRHRLPATLETLGSYLTSLKRKLIIPIRQSRLWANATEALPETGEISINGPDAAHRGPFTWDPKGCLALTCIILANLRGILRVALH